MTEASIPSGNFSQPSLSEERIEKYINKLSTLKERNALREVMERDLLLSFIQVNHQRINEFPLLATYQSSISNILYHRSATHPAHDFIRQQVGSFLHLLNQYDKANRLGDTLQASSLKGQITNTETLLLKCVQGAVYSASLTHDNMEEVLLKFFGETASEIIDEIAKTHELDRSYWKTLIETFVTRNIHDVYSQIIAQELYTIVRVNADLALQFDFACESGRLKASGKNIQQTRLQQSYCETLSDNSKHQQQKLILAFLAQKAALFGKDVLPEQVVHIARIICLDPVSIQLQEKIAAPSGNEHAAPDTPEVTGTDFILQQILSMALGATIVLDIIREDFLASFTHLGSQECQALRGLLKNFDLPAVTQAIVYLQETHLQSFLKSKCEGEGNKISIRTSRNRLLTNDEIEPLCSQGLTKIRKNKLWEALPENSKLLRFKCKNQSELSALMQIMQMESPLANRIYDLWNSSSPMITCGIVIHLDAISRTSTNLKSKLAEILGEFGVVQR